MRNAKKVNYFQVDNKIEYIVSRPEVEILPADLAWQKYKWTREYFVRKPKEGYFIWLKENSASPLLSCVSLSKKKAKQSLDNLIVIEKGVKGEMRGTCNVLKKDLAGTHQARGVVLLKEKAALDYKHFHSWGEEEIIHPSYDFILEKEARLNYLYKNISSPKQIDIKTSFRLLKGASADIKIVADCRKTRMHLEDSLVLAGDKAKGQISLRLAAREGSKIRADSEIIAEKEARGHLDCQGLLISNKAVISLLPGLICKNKKSQLTHEASIGKVSEEELNYLMTRGLNESEALKLIVNGFLAL
jgi:Fe-S cluster assembly scaffold protein SufB